MRTLQRVGAGLCALTLFVGLAACGDDDDTDEGTQAPDDGGTGGGEQASGDTDAFCTSLVEFNGAVLSSDIDETSSEEDIVATGEQLAPIIDEVATNAPDDLADQAETIKSYVDPLVDGDAEAFNSDATFDEYTAFVADAVQACGFETVAVTGLDYAFQGVPESIEAGTVAFEFTNDSAAGEDHEMLIIRKADGVTQSFEEIVQLPEEESESLVEFKGAAFAPAGESSGTLAELTPGDYAMLCFIPVGSPDTEDGPPHVAEGMIAEFTVE